MAQQIGACSVTYKSTDLGNTIGGVAVKVNGEFVDIYEDQHGRNMLDKIHVGDIIEVTARFSTDSHAMRTLFFPQATDSGGNKLTFGRNPGLSLLTGAGLLVLHPVYKGATDYSKDVGLYKAIASQEGDYMFDNTEEAGTWEIKFTALCDTSRTTTDQMGYIGGSGGA